MHKALMVTTSNGNQFGNNAFIAPQASMEDGKLEVTLIRNVPDTDIAAIVGAMFSKNIGRLPSIDQWSVQKAHYQVDEPIAYHLDGEPMGKASTFELHINQNAIRVLHDAQAL